MLSTVSYPSKCRLILAYKTSKYPYAGFLISTHKLIFYFGFCVLAKVNMFQLQICQFLRTWSTVIYLTFVYFLFNNNTYFDTYIQLNLHFKTPKYVTRNNRFTQI